MSLLFNLRSNSTNTAMEARYTIGSKVPIIFGGAPVPVLEADATAIDGYRIKIDGGVAGGTFNGLKYTLGRNGTSTSVARSMHIRLKVLAKILNCGVIECGAGLGGIYSLQFALTATGTSTHTSTFTGAGSANGTGTVAWVPALDTWYDVVVIWDGVTTTNGYKIWVDGSLLGTGTATTSRPTPGLPEWLSNLSIGYSVSYAVTKIYVNEVNLWDEVIDPTAVTLTSGSGSLSGAARTAFVDAAAVEGMNNVGVSAANVLTGVAYTESGIAKTGTLDTAASVWNALTTSHTTAGSFGALIQKLLTTAKFLGLK